MEYAMVIVRGIAAGVAALGLFCAGLDLKKENYPAASVWLRIGGISFLIFGSISLIPTR